MLLLHSSLDSSVSTLEIRTTTRVQHQPCSVDQSNGCRTEEEPLIEALLPSLVKHSTELRSKAVELDISKPWGHARAAVARSSRHEPYLCMQFFTLDHPLYQNDVVFMIRSSCD